jgi:hypothetical protein
VSNSVDDTDKKDLMKKAAREMIDYLYSRRKYFSGDFKFSKELGTVPNPINHINIAITHLELMEYMISEIEFVYRQDT